MALIVAVERGWVSRAAALDRLQSMLTLLLRARCYHGAFRIFWTGAAARPSRSCARTTAAIWSRPRSCAWGCCARGPTSLATRRSSSAFAAMIGICGRASNGTGTPADGREVLYWHWSPYNGWAIDHEIHGWNECLITYVLAAALAALCVDPHRLSSRVCQRPASSATAAVSEGIELPLGPTLRRPAVLRALLLLRLDPRGLRDRHADYWQQNLQPRAHQPRVLRRNPNGFRGYGPDCWGLTPSDSPAGYARHAPDNDDGTITPTAALASFPYAPQEAMRALRHFCRCWAIGSGAAYGFIDAFCEQQDWFADTYLAIDQGPIIVMIENYRTGLLWRLFMPIPEVQQGLRRLGFATPYLVRQRGT